MNTIIVKHTKTSNHRYLTYLDLVDDRVVVVVVVFGGWLLTADITSDDGNPCVLTGWSLVAVSMQLEGRDEELLAGVSS